MYESLYLNVLYLFIIDLMRNAQIIAHLATHTHLRPTLLKTRSQQLENIVRCCNKTEQ